MLNVYEYTYKYTLSKGILWKSLWSDSLHRPRFCKAGTPGPLRILRGKFCMHLVKAVEFSSLFGRCNMTSQRFHLKKKKSSQVKSLLPTKEKNEKKCKGEMLAFPLPTPQSCLSLVNLKQGSPAATSLNNYPQVSVLGG